jgi:hypothetical protein
VDSYLSRKEMLIALVLLSVWLTVPSQKDFLPITTSPPRRHGRRFRK